ncbi:MAG: hypothetical protein IIB38_15440, partial [Candidatus Hydrogenedentes bacterium]|nr:hypothetical protein [Candidatus Hydrogenedentota bacterium]
MTERDALDPSPSDSPKPPGISRYLAVVGLTLYAILVWYIGWQKVRDELANANLGLILFAA